MEARFSQFNPLPIRVDETLFPKDFSECITKSYFGEEEEVIEQYIRDRMTVEANAANRSLDDLDHPVVGVVVGKYLIFPCGEYGQIIDGEEGFYPPSSPYRVMLCPFRFIY